MSLLIDLNMKSLHEHVNHALYGHSHIWMSVADVIGETVLIFYKYMLLVILQNTFEVEKMSTEFSGTHNQSVTDFDFSHKSYVT